MRMNEQQAYWEINLQHTILKLNIAKEAYSSNVGTSEFDFMERDKQDNNAWQTLPDNFQTENNMIQPSQNFQFILGDLMEMLKL